MGLPADPQLRALIDADYHPIALPPEGLHMTRYLAEELALVVGDKVTVEILEGHRRSMQLTLAGLVDEPLGVSAYMELEALNHLMREGPALSGAWLMIDQDSSDQLVQKLNEASRVAGIGMISEIEDGLREYLDDTVLVMMSIFAVAGRVDHFRIGL